MNNFISNRSVKPQRRLSFTVLAVLGQISLVLYTLGFGVIFIPQQATAATVSQSTVTTTWPTDGQWIVPICNDDPAGDEHPSEVDLKASGVQYGAAYFADANNVYIRERVDGDPGTPGSMHQYAWVFIIQKDTSTTNYDYLLSLRGSGAGENVELWQNTTPNGPINFDPLFNDPAETLLDSWSTATNARVTTVGSPSDYYVDWQIPILELTSRGVNLATDGLYFATSTNSNNYNKDHLNCYNAPLLSLSKQIQKNHTGAWFEDGRDANIQAVPGDTLTYRIGITNGGGPATNVTVVDELGRGGPGDGSQNIDPATQYSSWMSVLNLNADGNGLSYTGSWGNGTPDDQPNDTLTLNLANLAGGGAEETATFDAVVRSDLPVGNYLFENFATNDTRTAETDIEVASTPPPLGALLLTKYVDSGNASPDSFSFTIAPDPNDVGTVHTTSGTYLFDNLPAGDYTVSESPFTDYHVVSNTCTDVHVAAGQQASCAYHNTRDTGVVTIMKSVQGGSALPADWAFSIASVPGTFHSGDQVTLATGNYDISESGPAGYTLTGATGVCSNASGNSADLVVTTQGGTCTFTNTRDTGSITVNKQIDTNGDGTYEGGNTEANALGFRWGYDANPVSQSMGSTVTGVPTGAHTATENSVSGYHFVGWYASAVTSSTPTPVGCAHPQGTTLPVDISVVDGQTTSITLCNARDTGTVTLEKVVQGGTSVPADWAFAIVGVPGTFHSGDHVTLPTGTYNISESGPDGYTNTGVSGICSQDPTRAQIAGVTLTVTTNGGTCTFTNTRNTGSITVNKQVDTNGDGTYEGGNTEANALGFRWGYDANPADRQMGSTATGIPTGAHTATENSVSGYHFVGWFRDISSATTAVEYSCTNPEGTTLPVGINVADGQTASITLCNARETGTIEVRKNVVAPDGVTEVNDDHAFNVTLDGSDQRTISESASAVYLLVPTGSHTIAELGDANYDLVSITGDGTINVVSGQTAVVDVVNKQKPATITLVKDVRAWDGSDVVDNTSFSVTLNSETKSFAEGANATFTVNPGTYTAVESAHPDYILAGYDPADTATVGSNGQATITVRNNQNHHSVAIDKTDDVDPVQAGAVLTYTINWQNTGNAPVTNMTITDPLPVHTTFVSASNGGTEMAGVVTWNLGTQNPGVSGSVTLQVNVATPLPDGTRIYNTATIASDETSPQNAYAETTVAADFGVAIEKSGPEVANAGTDITYTLNWSVSGNEPVDQLIITDPLPANTTFVSASDGGTESAGVVTWNLGNHVPGDYDSLTLTVHIVSPLVNGTVIPNTATVCGSNGGIEDKRIDEGQKIHCAEGGTRTLVSSSPIITVIKSDAPDPVQAGGQLTYTIAWNVSGNAPVTDLTITDPIPANTTFVSASDSGTESAGVVTWNLGDHVPGDNGTVLLVVNVASPLPNGTILNNTATISSEENEPVFDTETTTVASASTLTLTKTPDVTEVAPNGTIVYTLGWSVAGNAPVTNLTVTDTLPTNATFVTASNGGTELAGVVTWNLGNHVPGDNGTLTVTITANGGLENGMSVVNNATATSNETNPVTASATTPVVAAPNLTITKTASVDTVDAGKTVTYTVVVKNIGNGTALNVTLSDTLPAGLTFVDGGGKTMNIALGNLAPGASVTKTYGVAVSTTAEAGSYENVAKAQADNHGSVTAKATVEVTAIVIPAGTPKPKLSITKTADRTFANPGNTINYTITVKNIGKAKALDVKITDTLPAGLTFVDNGATTRTWSIGDLAVNAQRVINVSVKVSATAKAGTLENVATATATGLDKVRATARVDIRKPAVLGAMTETGTSARDYLIGSGAALLIAFGFYLLNSSRRRPIATKR